MGPFIPINADLHVDVMGLFCVLCFFVLGGDEIFFYEVEAVKFLDG
jgi:hypothetical protein